MERANSRCNCWVAQLLRLLLSSCCIHFATSQQKCHIPLISASTSLHVTELGMEGAKEYTFMNGLDVQNCAELEVQAGGECNDPTSNLVIELWALGEDGAPISPVTAVRGIIMAVAGDETAQVWLNSEGELGMYPPTHRYKPEEGLWPSYYNRAGVVEGRPYQQVFLPADEVPRGTRWHVTVANFGDWLDGFTVRASCSVNLPCPSASPEEEECGGRTHGSCSNVRVPGAVCKCSGDWGGYSCSAPVMDLTLSSKPVQLSVPPQSWQYFVVNFPKMVLDSDTSVLVELTQPQGSFNVADSVAALGGLGVKGALALQPRISDANSTSGSVLIAEAPTVAALRTGQLRARVPFQDQDFMHAYATSKSLQYINSIWIGVFNAAPKPSRGHQHHMATSEVPPMTLRVRWKDDPAMALCPKDCSNNGICRVPPHAASSASYACSCFDGYGGRWCDGSMQVINLGWGGSYKVSQSETSLAPLKRHYYLFQIGPPESTRTRDVKVFWSLDYMDNQTDMWLVTSPYYYGRSNGELFFDMNNTGIRNFTASFKARVVYSQDLYGYIMMVYNAGGKTSAYGLAVSIENDGEDSVFHWQLGILIGAGSLLAMLGASFFFHRFFSLQADPPATGRDVEEGGDGNGPQLGAIHREVRVTSIGVPADVIATFPLFKYGESEADGVRHADGGGDGHSKSVAAAELSPADASSNTGGAGQAGEGDKGDAAAKPAPAVASSNTDGEGQAGGGDKDDAAAEPAPAVASSNTEASAMPDPDMRPSSSAEIHLALLGPGVLGHMETLTPPGSNIRETHDVPDASALAPMGMPKPSSSSVEVAQASVPPPSTEPKPPNMGSVPKLPYSSILAHSGAPSLGSSHCRPGKEEREQSTVVGNRSTSDSSDDEHEEHNRMDEEDRGDGDGDRHGDGLAADLEHTDDACSVCIVEYEQGEVLRRLPCHHYFHQACIDRWMQRHSSCPICRRVLVEASVLAQAMEEERNRRVDRARRRRQHRRQMRLQAEQQRGGGGGRSGGGGSSGGGAVVVATLQVTALQVEVLGVLDSNHRQRSV